MNQYDAYGPSVRKYGLLADARKLGQADHLDRDQAGERRQIELGRLHVARQVGDDQDRFALVAAQVGEHLAVGAADELERAAAEARDAACASRSAASSS